MGYTVGFGEDLDAEYQNARAADATARAQRVLAMRDTLEHKTNLLENVVVPVLIHGTAWIWPAMRALTMLRNIHVAASWGAAMPWRCG